MRKFLVLLAGSVVVLSLFSPAEAARRTYGITLNPAPKGSTPKLPAKSYNDTALDVSEDTADGRERTIIKGKLTLGGRAVKGRTVHIYATNRSTKAKKRVKLGAVTTSSSGYFAKTFKPGHDHAGLYRIEIVKYADSKGKERRVNLDIRVFQYVEAMNFYDAEASNPPTDPVTEPVRYAKDALPAYGQKFDQSFLIDGGSTAVFDVRGQTCLQFIFKMTRALDATVDGSFSVKRGSTTVVSRSLNGVQYLAPRLPFTGDVLRFAVAPYDDLDDQTVDDNKKVTMILGRPMVSCTYPIINP